jgi:hypothetical protein
LKQFQRVLSSKRVLSALYRVAGSLWTAENTFIGVAYGLIGIPTQGIGFQYGQLQFRGNLLQGLLSRILTGGSGAIVFGDAGIYPRGFGPETITDCATGQTLGLEESYHSGQARILGPFYLPANIVGGTLGLIRDGYWHGPANFMERGPHRRPPQRFCRRGHRPLRQAL